MKHFWILLFSLPLLAPAARAQSLSERPPAQSNGPGFQPARPGVLPVISDSAAGVPAPRQDDSATFQTRAEPHGPIFTLVEENDDLANNGDQHYTQGIRLSYTLAEDQTPHWAARLADRLPVLGMRMESPRIGLAVGQNMYTPKNIFTPAMVRADRPYAGWLYLGAILQRRGLTARDTPVLDHFGLDLGIIGPDSLADQTQTWWHALGGWILPRGWHHQLKSEPGLTLKYDRQWKFSPTRPEAGWGIEFIPHAGVSLGNVQTFLTAGAMVRAGYHIPDDFGVQNIDSLATQAGGRTSKTPLLGAYLFAGVESRAVARNAFLDGNLWRPSLSVKKEPLVGDLKVGGVLAFKHLDLALTFVERTREFKGQSRNDRFGSLSINMKF